MPIIAADQRLSRSILWDIERRYFLSSGMKAWQEDVVPHTISSSPHLARAYSQVVLGYLRDCVAAWEDGFLFDPGQPIYIVELGAGSGRLAHHFLHEFHNLLAQSPFAALSVKYIMTDFVPEILSFWQSHERFQPWLQTGLLDFALYDAAERERPLFLHHAAHTLTLDQVHNPLILIANYFFDSIPQDSFVIEEGQLSENLLSVYSSQPEPNLADPSIWERLELAYEAIPLSKPYYAEPVYNEILDDYEAYFPDTTLTFPNVALDCLRQWQKWGNGRFLLLSSDRGHTLPDSLLEQPDPLPNLHGSFSLMVNYHALGQYTEKTGGLALQTAHYQDAMQINAYLWGTLPLKAEETRLAYTQAIAQGGPDDFFAIRQALEASIPTLTLPQLLSYLRLSAWDAGIFQDCYAALLKHTQETSPAWYPDIHEAINHVWQRYLPLSPQDDLLPKMNKLLQIMQDE